MTDDVFAEDSLHSELQLAQNELTQKLNSIETAAFHEGFEESREKYLQKAFDTGYELIYKHFQAIATLEGVYDSLHSALPEGHQFEDIKSHFTQIYAELFTTFNRQIDKDVESKICMDRNYSHIHIVPSADIIQRFNQVKSQVIQLCTSGDLTYLCQFLDSINL